MPRTYDNWERVVSAVLRREHDRQLCLLDSVSPSPVSSSSSDFSSNFNLNSSSSHTPSFDFAIPNHGLSFQTVAGIKVTAPALPEQEQLIFVKGSPLQFGVHRLLHAPSKDLGEELETFNRSFVVSLREDTKVVLKRIMIVKILGREMKIIGSDIYHDNLVTVRGYYLPDNQAFGIYDYFSRGSLSTMLYGKRGQNWRVQLDLDTRIRIAIGAAKGLAYIHKQLDGKIVHGNLKASNIFLNSRGYGCIADINLPNFVSRSAAKITAIGGYRPPEVQERPMASQACDVYSFGVLLIEILSGASPMHATRSRYGDWAFCKAREDWTSLVFDRGLLESTRIKKVIRSMLNVGLSCVVEDPEKRISMESVVEMLERNDLLGG